jgi:hypothetical protein
MPNIGRDPEITKNEIEAGRRGGELVGEAAGTLQRQYESGAANATQQASVFGNQAQQGEQLKEQKRATQVHEAETEDQQGIEMADKGLEQQGPSRADRLRQEMENGRQSAQMDKPLEVQGPDSKTGTVQQGEQRKSLDTSKAVTNQMSAQARYLNALKSYNGSKITGDKDLEKSELKSLQQPIESASKLFDEGKNGKLTESQWGEIKDLASGNPDPALQSELAQPKTQFSKLGPAVGRFLQSRINFTALTFMAHTGEMPDGKLVDMASPEMQQFTSVAGGVQDHLRQWDELTGGAMSESLGIDTLAKRNQVVRQMAANAMLKQMQPLPSGGGSNPVPSQGGPSARPQQPGSGTEGAAPPDVNRKPKLGAPGSNPNAGTDQAQLRAREQRGIEQQQAADEQRRNSDSGAAESIRRARSGY